MKTAFALAIVLATASFGANAGELGYTYAELGYQQTDIDGLAKADGAAFNASIALGESLHLFGGFARQHGDETVYVAEIDESVKVNLDNGVTRVGLGYHHAFNERVHLIAQGAWQRTHIEAAVAGSDDELDLEDDGYTAEVGVRGLMAERFEGWALAGWAHAASSSVEGFTLDQDGLDEDEAFVRLGAQFKFNANWGLVGEGRVGQDTNAVFVGLRGTFDNWD